MAQVKISGSGNPVLDGDYPLDTSFFTNRELHTIKDIAGVRAGELEDALRAGDNDVVVAIALIALRRAGKQVPADVLWDLPAGRLVLDLRDDDEQRAEDDALPPVSGPGGNAGAVVTPINSGVSSSESTGQQDSDRSRIGTPASATGAVSG